LSFYSLIFPAVKNKLSENKKKYSMRRFLNFSYLKEQIFEIMNDGLDEAEDDIIAVQHIDVGGGLAELDAGDGPRLNHRLVGAPVRLQRFLHRVNKVLLLQMAGAAGGARVRVIYFLQDLIVN
jgi:hypothetical protein